MVKRVCDRCENQERDAIQVGIPTGKFQADPAGGSSSEVIHFMDLCLHCAARYIEGKWKLPK